MKDSAKRAILVASLGYIMLVASVLAIVILMKLATGHYPAVVIFTFSLVTLGLFAIHPAFIIAPLPVAWTAMILLQKRKVKGVLSGGVAVASYYALAMAIYAVKGAGDIAWDIYALWTIWAFVLGAASAKIAERFKLG